MATPLEMLMEREKHVDYCDECEYYIPCNKTGIDKDYCLIRYLIWEAHNG